MSTSSVTFRPGVNGGLWVPRRGTPPPTPVGYEPSPKNPFFFYKILFPCDKLKVSETFKPGCGCKIVEWKCDDKITTRQLCEGCQNRVWEETYGSQGKDLA